MKNLISKLLTDTITERELVELRKWLNDPQNQSVLESYVQDYHDLNLTTLKNNVHEAYNKVVDNIERDERPVKKLIPNWAKYAAAVVLLFGIGFIFQQDFVSSQHQTLIVPKEESITLELDNGDIQTIDVSQTKNVRDADGNIIGNQKQNQISYSRKNNNKVLLFNSLTIPNGKQFELELSDGTLVHLNAGSSVRYPVNFLPTESRRVFISGEAYFEVAKDSLRPFIVNVDDLDIKVLGTKFNISAYKEDAEIEVVLVDGAVSLDGNGGSQGGHINLVPGQKGSFNHVSKNIRVGRVNTALYTAWREGHLIFRNLTFDNILTKLERHYNIEIENTNTELGREVFNASFNNVEIEKVLSFFNDTHKIDYTVQNNKVLIR